MPLNNKKEQIAWFGFFVEWHINLCELFNSKTIFVQEQ